MVSHTRLKTFVTTLVLYVVVGGLIAYFGVNAFSGEHGLRAKEQLAAQLKDLTAEHDKLKDQRIYWERHVALLRSESLDPDTLDERARAMLDYVHPRDLVMLGRDKIATGPGPLASAR
ncbi:MAG: septum formation initiator family protein [Variibacter sp.]